MRACTANGPKRLPCWHDINWKKTNRIVNNLRQRIFRAIKEDNYTKARSLQKLMLKSYSNLILSTRKVTQINLGKKTPGIDKKIALIPSMRMELVQELSKEKMWKAQPVRRIFIPKKGGKNKRRPLGIPVIADRCRQTIVKNALEPEWEAKFEGSSYGFRPGRSAHDAISKIFRICLPKNNKKWALDADLYSAFDKISHDFVLKALGNFPAKTHIEQWLKAGYVEYGQIHKTESGAPQGGCISPLICNIALHGMEDAIGVQFDKAGYNRGSRISVRYADDFLCFSKTKEDAYKCKETLSKWLYQRGLAFSEEKTRIVNLAEGFDFLGYNVRQYVDGRTKTGWKLLIKPSKDSVNRIREKIRNLWRSVKGHNIEHVIKKLNPVIRGWANYHRIVVAKKIFASLDNWMYQKQYKWARKTHPKKGGPWIANKYW